MDIYEEFRKKKYIYDYMLIVIYFKYINKSNFVKLKYNYSIKT